MKTYEFSAKNVEKAIELGLKELNKKQEEVDIKIVDAGGLFKKAKIQILVEEEPVEEKVETYFEETTIKTFENESEKIVEETVVSGVNGDVVETQVVEVISKNQQEKEVSTSTNQAEFVKDYLENIAKNMGLTAEVKIEEDAEKIYAVIKCDKSGKIIGFRGEGLNALQYLTNISAQRIDSKAKRIVVDIENYREKREESLKQLAERIAQKVERTGKPYKFEPMTANERRIIHSALAENSNVETKSNGEDPRRYLTVYPVKK